MLTELDIVTLAQEIVEFVAKSGETLARLTLEETDIHIAKDVA